MKKPSDIRVLYVEDDEHLCELFKLSVGRAGYSVDVAYSGEEGLAMHADASYDIVVLDYQLPDITGIDIARKLLTVNKELPIIMVTGKGNEQIAIEALSLGISHYVAKDTRQVFLELIPNYVASVLVKADAIQQRNEAEASLKASENRLAMVLEGSQQGFWDWNIETGEVQRNDRWAKMLGYSSIDEFEATTDTWTDSIHPDDRDAAWASINDHLEGRSPIHQLEYRMLTKSGGIKWIRDQAKIVQCDNNGRPLRMCGTHTDVTERIALEEQLRQSQKMEIIGQLAGGVAHDFNNLLGVMIGSAQLLELRIGKDEKALRHIKDLFKAINRGSTLTNRLLAYSRQQSLSPQPTEINGLVLSLEDMLKRTLGETVELSTHLRPNAHDALIDPHQLENALINLAVNSKHAMPNGGALTIETANITLDEAGADKNKEVTPGDYVRVSVSDTGTGMTPEVLENVFEPFFTTKDVGEGSGLGLSMVYGFVKQSKGHISIDSEVGHGTTINLYLPRSVKADAKETNMVETPELARGTEHILVVEDDELLRDIATMILREQGYQITEAGNGKEAIQALKSGQTFDLLFTDMVLPGGMNGAEIAEEAKRIQPNIKTIYTTGYSDASIVLDGTLVPGVTLAKKPYDRAELFGMIRTMLDSADDCR